MCAKFVHVTDSDIILHARMSECLDALIDSCTTIYLREKKLPYLQPKNSMYVFYLGQRILYIHGCGRTYRIGLASKFGIREMC